MNEFVNKPFVSVFKDKEANGAVVEMWNPEVQRVEFIHTSSRSWSVGNEIRAGFKTKDAPSDN